MGSGLVPENAPSFVVALGFNFFRPLKFFYSLFFGSEIGSGSSVATANQNVQIGATFLFKIKRY